jgi:peptide/nickel transport system substrate-binding protein
MKRIIAILIVLTLVFNFVACKFNDKDNDLNKEGQNNIDEKSSDENLNKQREAKGSIIYGSTVALTGNNFFTNKWGENITDKIVRELIHGYETVVYQKETASYGINNTVVKNFNTIENSDGTKTFEIEINSDLTYSDNSPITAKDYVFSILLSAHPELADIGAKIDEFTFFVGYDEYSNRPNGSEEGQNSDVFEGVRLLSDYKFSVTVKKSELPYFYDIIYAKIIPYPMAMIAPDADIADDGNGAKIIGEFSSEVLEKTINDPDTGYRFSMNVTSGAYVLDSYNFIEKVAILKHNPYFKGDYSGQKPQIAEIIIKYTPSATQIDDVIAGNIDILPAVSGKDLIKKGLNAEISMLKFQRAGYGKLAFMCDIGATQFVKVRQAIAYCINSSELIRNYSEKFAKSIYGMYGLGQWMYKKNETTIENELNKYEFDLEKAKSLLIEDGWTLNSKGSNYVEGTDDIRYKMYNGILIPLEINHLSPSDSPISDILADMLPDNFKAVGIKYENTVVSLPVLLNYMKTYALERQYNMMNLATNFSAVFDPYYSYHTDEQYMGTSNVNFIKDENLMRLADEMRKTPSSDKEVYSNKWLEFQKEWNRLLPDVPLYSDEYHVFYSSKLKNYEIDAFWEFQQAILYSYIEE